MMDAPDHHWQDATIAALIGLLSLLLLTYAGLGEAYRTYPGYVMASLASQGQVVQDSIDTFLDSGLPVTDFPGMDTMGAGLIATNPRIARVGLDDDEGHEVFATAGPGENKATSEAFAPGAIRLDDGLLTVEESPSYYRVRLPVKNKFETMGALRLDLPRAQIRQAVGHVFLWVWLAGSGLFLLYVAAATALGRLKLEAAKAERAVAAAYGLTYMAMACVVIAGLVTLYTGAIQAETQAQGVSLARRLDAAFALGLDLPDFLGMTETFQDYKRRDPDLGYAVLVGPSAHGEAPFLLGTTAATAGSGWRAPLGYFDFPTPVGGTRTLHVGVRVTVVERALWRSVKNFLVLFVALGFVAVLFLNFRTLLAEKRAGAGGIAFQLGTVRPLYFLAVFMEGLASSFLPRYFTAVAAASHVPAAHVSSLFTTYFLAFVTALLPAGRIAAARGPRPLVLAGALLGAVGLALTASGLAFDVMYGARAIAGFGQGLLLVGVEAYILRFARAGQRTQASTVIVYGYNGGMISGGAIGALLNVYMGPQLVLVLGALIGISTLVFGLAFVRDIETDAELPAQAAGPGAGAPLWQSLVQCFKDLEFVRTTLLVGIPSKAVLTGVTIFAAPLLLVRLGYQQEDVGQILMFYAGGVLLSSRFIAKLVDRNDATRGVLTLGIVGSAVGLLILGLAGWTPASPGLVASLALGLPIIGLFVLGLSHGFINAPVITHINKTPVAAHLGGPVAGSLYRFLERAGHVSGPIIAGQILLATQQGAVSMTYIGAGVLATGLLYAFTGSRGTPVAVS